ncbi:calcium/sodium antiporter [Paenibacillus lemnae]|uniref:Calcium/sodium antiporter n=1 Tax=Paenibacillus lemnae TaxID=1330551 RepID=A0A848MDX3_PAELE|nr:calcium/sodium antiporter [Paenibacillus lemnae]NMO97614.1 calcium/sodium antiporter [Paenibacillus lemnae]
MTYLLLLVGFGLLIVGANYFVEGASKIATLLRVSPMLIGLTIVAFGTSSPEATVSIIAALNGSEGVALGNVVGSNVFNTTLILGLTALVIVIKVQSETIKKEIPFTLLASVVLLILVSDVSLQGMDTNTVTRGDGLILLSFLVIFLYYLIEVARNSRESSAAEHNPADRPPLGRNLIFGLAGLGAIIYGGHLVVQNSTMIALQWGMSETLVGLTIVAAGTSLPELVTSVAAALKGENEIAVGNIVGSNIFNILFVLGLSAVISPLRVEGSMTLDMLILIAITVILFVMARTGSKISRLEGLFLTALFAGYMTFIIIRG